MSQWQPDYRLTNSLTDSYTSANNAWCVAANGNDVHVVWFDERDGNREIYYKRSTNSGISWGSDTRLTNNTANSQVPSVIITGQTLLIVWQDNRDGNFEIYCKRSSDGGSNWGADIRLTNNPQISEFPSASASGQFIFITWHDERDTNFEIYGKRSTDGGLTWSADIRLTNQSYVSQFPCVSVLGQVVYIVWRDNRDGNDEIYFKKSTDGGNTWNTDIRLTNNVAISDTPCIVSNSSAVHVVWQDALEIYYIKSTDGGLSWGAGTRLTNNSSVSVLPSLAVSGSALHIAWQENRDGNYEIYYKNSSNGGINWSPDTRLTNNSSNSALPSAAVTGTSVHVVWHDNRDGNNEVYYKQNPTGNPVQIVNTGSEIPSSYNLYQNFPNPFNPNTVIRFQLPVVSQVVLLVYDMMGREVEMLVNETLKPETYEVTFDGSNLPSGIYFYQLKSENFLETKKLILLK